MVRPNCGLISPMSTVSIVICIHPNATLPDNSTRANMQTKDRFLLLVSPISLQEQRQLQQQQDMSNLSVFWNSRTKNNSEHRVMFHVDFTYPSNHPHQRTTVPRPASSSSAVLVPSPTSTSTSISISTSTTTNTDDVDTTLATAFASLHLPDEAHSIQSDLHNLEQRLAHFKQLNTEHVQKRQKALQHLRIAENALTKSNMDVQICLSEINILRPTLQRFIKDAREQQQQEEREGKMKDEEEDGVEDFKECTICLEEVEKKSGYALSCGHVFHRVCIKTWLVEKNCCPVCKNVM